MAQWTKQKRIDLNPSSADRWMTCTISPKFIYDNWDKLPPEDRKFADDGVTAHEVAAAYLQDRKPRPSECPVPITPEMLSYGFDYWDYVTGLRKPGSKLIVEQKLPLFYNESRNAIVDSAVINPDELHVVDYKYGEGIIVSPENNLQATIYAKSVVWGSTRWNGEQIVLPDSFPVFLHIYQPRTRDGEPYHTWETTMGDIRRVTSAIFKTAVNILHVTDPINPKENNLVFAPSDKACQWCPAKNFCTARIRSYVEDLEPLAVINGDSLPAGRVLTEKQLAAIVQHGDHIKKWIDDAQTFALQHMRAGNKIPGFKLVTSRGGNRYWVDPAKAAKYLLEDTILRKDEIYTTPSLVGPAAIEKKVGKGKIPLRAYNLITKPPGVPVIAPEDDPRPSCLINASEDFVDLDAKQVNLDQF